MTREELLQELNELIHDYPGNYPSEIRKALKDAREYLNPEPKVLTVEEIHKLPVHTIVWIEFWNNERGKSDGVIAGMMCKDRSIVDEETCVYDDFEKDMERNHGDCWRFWLGNPTDEQMKAIPWYWEVKSENGQ